MELIEEWDEPSAYTFLDGKSDQEITNLIDQYGCDHDLIRGELDKKYPEEEYFVLIDFIEENNGWFHIRIWRK